MAGEKNPPEGFKIPMTPGVVFNSKYPLGFPGGSIEGVRLNVGMAKLRSAKLKSLSAIFKSLSLDFELDPLAKVAIVEDASLRRTCPLGVLFQ